MFRKGTKRKRDEYDSDLAVQYKRMAKNLKYLSISEPIAPSKNTTATQNNDFMNLDSNSNTLAKSENDLLLDENSNVQENIIKLPKDVVRVPGVALESNSILDKLHKKQMEKKKMAIVLYRPPEEKYSGLAQQAILGRHSKQAAHTAAKETEEEEDEAVDMMEVE